MSISILNIDALECLSSLEPKQGPVYVITDPPYGETNKELYQGPSKDPVLTREYKAQFASLCFEKAEGVFMFCNVRQIEEYENVFESVGFPYVRCGVWIKPNAYWRPAPYTKGAIEAFIWACKTRKTSVQSVIPAYMCSTSGTLKPNEEHHPFRKPIPLIRKIIRDLGVCGSLIVDPFCGGGSIAVSALLEKCSVVAGDIDASIMENLEWRTKNFYLWKTSEPKEAIHMAGRRGKKSKFEFRAEERNHIIKLLNAHTDLVKSEKPGIREAEFLEKLLGKDYNRLPEKGKKREYGLIKRRVSVDRLWKECAVIARLAKQAGGELLIPKLSPAQRRDASIMAALVRTGVVVKNKLSKDQQALL